MIAEREFAVHYRITVSNITTIGNKFMSVTPLKIRIFISPLTTIKTDTLGNLPLFMEE